MSATIATINDNDPPSGNVFRNIFDRLVRGVQKLCCTKSELLIDTQAGEASGSGRCDEEFVDTNIGEEFTNNLSENVSDSSLVVPNGFQLINQIPDRLRRPELHETYVESLFRQLEAQSQISADLIKEDEEFVRRLTEEEKRDKFKHILHAEFPQIYLETHTTSSKPQGEFVRRLTEEEKRDKFKHILHAELPQVHLETHTPSIEAQEGVSESADESDFASQIFDHSATFYRDQAQRHYNKRNHFYEKAKQCRQEKNWQRAQYYFGKAKEQTRWIEQANNFAAAAFLSENGRRQDKNTIDLHHLYVKEAIPALDIFLDDEISLLRDKNLQTKTVMVVTGRGKHSADGIPKIKPAVMERLIERKLRYSEMNPGLLKVHITKYSDLTNDLNEV